MQLPQALVALLREPSLCYLSTIMPDGSPQLTQTWVDTDGKHILINTVRGHRKVENIERDPRVTIAVSDPKQLARYFEIRGRVLSIATEGAAAHIEKLSQRYLGRAYPWFGGRDQTRLLLTIEADKIHVSRGASVVTCSADGQAESEEMCNPRSECWTASCNGGSCRESPKSASTRCEGSSYCSSVGDCVDCTNDSHCSAMNDACSDGTCDAGTCRRTARARGETCRSGAGLCDRGTCENVECFSASDCTGAAATCTDGQCVICGDKKLGPGEECDLGATSTFSDRRPYDKWSCDSRCKRLYDYTPCASSNECVGSVCQAGMCATPCSNTQSPFDCRTSSGISGYCYAFCFLNCNGAGDSNCPPGKTCNAVGEPVGSYRCI
jgi:PPOX class probable F420-dependent enzyme